MLSASALVQLDVASGPIPSGARISAAGAGGLPISFELGSGLLDPSTGELNQEVLAVDARWNARDQAGNWRILPYWWDDSRRCLHAGAAEMWVSGHGYAFPTGDASRHIPGLALLIETASASPLDAPTREVVHLSAAVEEHDDLFDHDVTHLQWPVSEALAYDHDLTRTHLAGNLLRATEGRRHAERFVIDPPASTPAGPTPAVVRTGANASCGDPAPMYLHTLSQGRLAWLPAGEGGAPTPEIHLGGQGPVPGDPARTWRWRRRLLEAVEFEEAFTTDPVRFVDLVAGSSGGPLWEYDGEQGDSIRFGDDDFGQRPVAGTAFEVIYRVGSGALGNVAADAITGFDQAMAGVIVSVTNPFPASGGADPEPAERIRRLAPYAFQALPYRAVRAEDYEAAARSLPWVLDAGAVFRWTGSWLSVFTIADPGGTERIPISQHLELIDLLNRRRLAGYESFAPTPHYVGVDLIVTVCAKPWAFRGEVEAAILVELGTGAGTGGRPAFFSLDRFRLGSPLERSALEAAIQGANGVDGVLSILYRQRGLTPDFEEMPEVVSVRANDVLRVDNDASRPQRGSLKVIVEGGK